MMGGRLLHVEAPPGVPEWDESTEESNEPASTEDATPAEQDTSATIDPVIQKMAAQIELMANQQRWLVTTVYGLLQMVQASPLGGMMAAQNGMNSGR